jgi:hypothetical protein
MRIHNPYTEWPIAFRDIEVEWVEEAEAALTKILVRVHRCSMRAAVVVELPETDKLINCAGVGLEIADELLILPALVKRRKAKFLVELHGLCHRPDAQRICSQRIESHRKFLPGQVRKLS